MKHNLYNEGEKFTCSRIEMRGGVFIFADLHGHGCCVHDVRGMLYDAVQYAVAYMPTLL